MATAMPQRRSLVDIQADYDAGHKKELETLMRAWKGIKELDPADLKSFFNLGGYHGEPFEGPGTTDPAWWGGYCQHGTVLFPCWHRVYIYQFEKALQSIPGCKSVRLPFWDECSEKSRLQGIPRALTDKCFKLDGKSIPNPLRSFILPVGVVDQVEGDKELYSKPAGYETVRYPLSGLVGTLEDQERTKKHNSHFPDYDTNVKILNGNIRAWLNEKIEVGGNCVGLDYYKFVKCLDAPNFTLFSNTTSTATWNKDHPKDLVTAVESPHNAMHLAVGGFDVPGQGDFSPICGANGDMGENDTAAFDPIFFFHHSFIDYVFWTWQRKHGFTENFTINQGDPGALYGPNNPPPVDGDRDEPITMTTPLHPFMKSEDTVFTAADCINIERQLGYTYAAGSLDEFAIELPLPHPSRIPMPEPRPSDRTVHISGIDRSNIHGSFLISAYATVDGEEQLIGREAVLSRWQVAGCANCQNHLMCSADFRVPEAAGADKSAVRVEIRTRSADAAELVPHSIVIH